MKGCITMNLITKAKHICQKLMIDPDTIYAIFNIYSYIGNRRDLYGTVLKYEEYDKKVILITLESGWHKRYTFKSEILDTVRIVRDLHNNSFNKRQIADILSISRDDVEHIIERR